MNKTKKLQCKKFRSYKIFVLVMMLFAIGGFAFQAIYNNTPKHAISINDFTYTLTFRELKTDRKIKEIERLLAQGAIDSLPYITFEKLPSIFYVYYNDELIFWSDNLTEPQNIKNTRWQYSLLSNIHAITRSQPVGNYNIVAYIPVKHNYPYENEELKNTFFNGFKLDKEIKITGNNPTSPYAVYSHASEYLFTLELPAHPIYDEGWAIVAMLMFLVAFLIMFYLFSRFPLLIGQTSLSWRGYFIVSIVMGAFVLLCLKFNFPSAFFLNKIFTPYHYATNNFLNTLNHLSFLSLFIFSLIYLFAYYVKRDMATYQCCKWEKIVLLFLPGAYFMLIFYFLIGVVFNSSTDISILKIESFTLVAIWNHLLFLLWGVGLMVLHVEIYRNLFWKTDIISVVKYDIPASIFLCTAGYVLFVDYGLLFVVSYIVLKVVLYLPHVFTKSISTKWHIAIWLIFFTFFVTWASVQMNADKKFAKYRTLAENHYLNEENNEDRLAIAMLNDLNKIIINDQRIRYLVYFPDSIAKANEYINNTYLRGFWNKYEMRLFATIPDSELDKEFKAELSNWGRKVKTTNFYSMGKPNSDMTFLGAFAVIRNNNNNNNFYMEFYPKKYYKSYSFPNLLLETPPGIQSQLKLSSARYTFRELASSTGNFQYKPDAGWIEKGKENYFTQVYGGYKHYIYAPNVYNYFVLSEENDNVLKFLLYFSYVYLLFLCITFFTLWVYRLLHKKTRVNYSFSSKFLYSFTILLGLSFLSTFYVLVNYMGNKYVDEQKHKLEETKNYIQSALQEKYSWRESLDASVANELSFDLQDLSYIYQTDIHVYDNKGRLVASSQMPLFSRELISRQISPLPYFSSTVNMNQYEYIGNLEYLNAYTDFYNIDFLPIGYIAVPQFFSNYMVRADLENYLSVIINIYLIIIILFVTLSLLIGRQLSSPLSMLQDSLKQIKLGQRIQKIDYKPKDEIGQLVEQYNRTVEELEKSAQLLARSERESAWKTMARQVAHEINNPLTPMKLTIQQLQRRKAMNDTDFDEYFTQSSSMLIEQIENLSRIAGTFSTFAKLPEAKFTKVDVARKISSVTMLFSNSNENMKIAYRGPGSDIFIWADREQLIQVFNNLLKNAIQSIPVSRDGKIDVSMETEGSWVYIYVRDNGKGIADEVKDKLFTPNFTTKSTGMGLGLSISQNIIMLLGGEITFETKQGEGTTFRVALPKIK